MSLPFTILERVTIVSPLGIRFRDAATGRLIDSGLSVTAVPLLGGKRSVANYNDSGVYVFQSLPGLGDVQRGAGDTAYWSPPPPTKRFKVEVVDLLNRYLPVRFLADAPFRGLFTTDPAQLGVPPVPESAHVSLPVGPASPLPPGMAVVRASLFDPQANRPASWAILEARVNGKVMGRGVADSNGNLLLLMAYPAPPAFVPAAPAVPVLPLSGQSWPVNLFGFYGPPAPVSPDMPDLAMTITQPAASLWADAPGGRPLAPATLTYGRDLVVSSEPPRSNLLITPAVAPP